MKNLKPFDDFPLNESSGIGLQKIAQALDDIAIRLNGDLQKASPYQPS
jgi:hypothetical protein